MLFCRKKKTQAKKEEKTLCKTKFAKKEGHDDLFFLPARFDDPTHIV